jgi:methylenetetrahydrofolate dehydrogenase (NADP+)/methenyltetrahydrofolate cyclohydrolase
LRRIDGRAIAAAIEAELQHETRRLRSRGIVPTLAVVLSTPSEAAGWYTRAIQRRATAAGIACVVADLGEPTGVSLETELARLSEDGAVHGILCQTPVPAGIRLDEVAWRIAPAKDVDGANPLSMGRLAVGLPAFAPATAEAVLEILHREQVPLAGTPAVVVGRSAVVGKPAALLLLREHATVTICHTRTVDLAGVCAGADVLVVAAGRTRLIGLDHVKAGAVVIDVGTNPLPDGSFAGDVDADAVGARAGALTPVPGGVGPVTTSLLLRHVVEAAARAAAAP